MTLPLPVRLGTAIAVLLAAPGASPAAVRAPDAPPATLRIDYGIKLFGLPIGVASVSGAVGPRTYRLDADAKLTGLAGVLIESKGAAAASGGVAPQGRAVPATFAVSAANSKGAMTIRMAEAKGAATGVEIMPPFEPMPDRVPLTRADMSNMIDPLSAFFMPVPGTGAVLGPATCNRVLPLFDGGVRFDIVLTYSGLRQVETAGYKGPVADCAARYRPRAGHRPQRSATKFMVDNREMSVWLAPVAGTRFVVPYRASVMTMMGTPVVVEATSFSAAAPAGAAGAPAGAAITGAR